MEKLQYKVFRDNVHGYIQVPVDYVRLFIDTDIFQRLRNIEQTGMRTLYPSARHDRFIHSLGTYHLGCKAFESFRNNVEEFSIKQLDVHRKHYNVFGTCNDSVFWDKCGILFQIGCLLHDSGHAPFSHTLEFVYEHPATNNKLLTEKLLQCLATAAFKRDFVNQGTQHEKMSALVVCVEFWDEIESLLKKYKLKIADDSDDVEFIARMIIGCKYTQDSKVNRIKNCLISLLNSTSIDVDSLDYIVRDSKLSGIDNMSVDVERLLGSLTLVEKTVFKNQKMRNSYVCTNIINGSLATSDGNKASLDAQYRGGARINVLDGIISGSVSMSGNVILKKDQVPFVPAKSNILKVGGISNTHKNTIPSTANSVDIELFGVTKSPIEMEGSSLTINKEFNGKIVIQADEFEIDSAFIDGNMTGILSGELLGYHCHLGGNLTCELGFHKSSLSVIQNVLVARNYEYQWIYAHHKVVYFSNYLIIELLNSCIRYLLKSCGEDERKYEYILTSMMCWESMVKDDNGKYNPYEFNGISFLRPSDSDIMAVFRKCQVLCLTNDDVESDCARLLKEYYTRVYKKSLWKSYAEYGIFFSDFSDDEKTKLYDLFLAENKDNSVIDQYGSFNEEWKTAFKECGMQDVVWVSADSKLKALSPDNTCILFKNDTTLNYGTVTLAKDVQVEQKLNFFYIYYEDIAGFSEIDETKIKAFLHNKLKNFT